MFTLEAKVIFKNEVEVQNLSTEEMNPKLKESKRPKYLMENVMVNLNLHA